MSDYRYRGSSLSDEQPAATITLSYDHPSGFYGQLTGVAADTRHNGLQMLGAQAYAGYAQRLASGASLDVGVTGSDFHEYYGPHYGVQYVEAYAGLSLRNVSAHLYYSPNYLGEHVQTLYASLDGAMNPRPDVRLFAHAGFLTPVRLTDASEIRREQYDLSAGLALQIKAIELKLLVTTFGPNADYPAERRQSPTALVASATYAF